MITLPKSQELVVPVLRVLAQHAGEVTNSQIEELVKEMLSIPQVLAATIHSGSRTELAYRLAWARTKAKTSGLIASPRRETWTITEKGHLFLSNNK
jgi:restriction system protein